MKRKYLLALGITCGAALIWAAAQILPGFYTFQPDEAIRPAELNHNFAMVGHRLDATDVLTMELQSALP